MKFLCCLLECPTHVRRTMRSHLLKCGVIAGLFVGLVGIGIFNAAFCVPRFYAERLRTSDADSCLAGQQLSRKVEQFNSDVTKPGEWQVEFSEEQINAWLANELLQRLPRALPPNVFDPRVAIQENLARVAAQYRCGNLTAVLTLEVDPFVTGDDNNLAIRIRAAKIGSVPGLADRARQSIQYASMRSRIRIHWQQEPGTGDWVGRFKFDVKIFDLAASVKLREITLRDGFVCLRGETLRPPQLVIVPPVVASLCNGVHSATVAEIIQQTIRPSWSDEIMATSPTFLQSANLVHEPSNQEKAQCSRSKIQR